MPALSPVSSQHLATCHPDLQAVFNAVAEELAIIIICGYRDEYAQNQAQATGHSNARWGQSKHDVEPSLAVDAGLLPLNWDRLDDFRQLNDVVQKQAALLGVKVLWGGDFASIKDYDHFELA